MTENAAPSLTAEKESPAPTEVPAENSPSEKKNEAATPAVTNLTLNEQLRVNENWH